MTNSETVNSKKSVQPPNLSLPKGGGAIRGIGETFQPNAFSGTGDYSIPIAITSARGSEPRLSIDYNSGAGNGAFGLGFSLSIPKISVRTSLGIPRYDGNDIFLFNGSELVRKDKATYHDAEGFEVNEYFVRIEGSFSLIRHHIRPDRSFSYWDVTDTANQNALYGKTQASQIYNMERPEQIFEWLISESTDVSGNKAVFSYKAENEENVPHEIWTKGHLYNNKYIQSIRYGNYMAPGAGVEQFAFEILFNYGEYDVDAINQGNKDPHFPFREWKHRPDPFSSYTSGFEIRTCRLCQDVLLFHCMENELGDPCLVRRWSLEYINAHTYQKIDVVTPSLVRSITLTGYRREGKKSSDLYQVQTMPSAVFGFSEFSAPEARHFEQLKVDSGLIPGYLRHSDFVPVDLHREGISGFLYGRDTLLYLSPEGDGVYSPPQAPGLFPINNDVGGGGASLTDLDGSGELDLVVNGTWGNGYYSLNERGEWQNLQSFESYPNGTPDMAPEQAGLSNNGKTDLIVVQENQLSVYESMGRRGYAQAKNRPTVADFPIIKQGYLREYVGFANLFGDGLPHRVKITGGSVECWPDLGYGNFAQKIVFGNAPQFGSDFDTRRLFFSDISGSGTIDLIYAHPSHVEVFFNQNGNAFSDGVRIMLPEAYTDLDQIGFADILGNGTNCLVFTKIADTPRHYYYNFVGEILVDGQWQKSLKPYLLNTIDNNLGTTTQIQYCSSTRFYLQDRKAGTPWITRLPFPVQVVEKVIVTDGISNTRHTRSFKYHDGYYDTVDGEFRGFGYVESWDSETYSEFTDRVGRSSGKAIDEDNFVAPVYTRTWHHTGVFFQNQDVVAHYKKQFFQGDADACDFPGPVFDQAIDQHDPETLRQAYVALRGQVIRTEVYGHDPEQHPDLYQNPYTVSQANQKVALYQPKGNNPYAVFVVTPRESINYHYERNPQDPRVTQDFTLETDVYGNTVLACSIFLPRRDNPSIVIYPEQRALSGTLLWSGYVAPPAGNLFCHQGCETQTFQLYGLSPGKTGYFSFDDIKNQLSVIDVVARKNIISYGSSPVADVAARQLGWEKSIFWDETLEKPLPPGVISPLGLLHHQEHAVFDKDFSVNVYGGRLIGYDDYADQKYLAHILYTQGGYFFDEVNAYWWNKGLVQHYLRTGGYYMPSVAENTFAFESQNGSHPQDLSLCVRTSIAYDAYHLAIVRIAELVDANTDNVMEAQMDYVTLQPRQITDINENKHQALFDPLGQVIVTSLIGTEHASPVGGMTLYANGSTPPEYKLPVDPSFEKVVDTMTGGDYLQGASTYFYYNLHAWSENRQPACAVQLTRFNYWNAQDKHEQPAHQTGIEYSDGQGRVAAQKMRTAAGLAFVRGADGKLKRDSQGNAMEEVTPDRWQVSGRRVFNNKGQVYQEYLPYFVNSPLYQGDAQVPGPPPTVTIYDPTERVIRINSPKGFFSKVVFTPWEEAHHDEDDTVLDSEFYKANYPHNLTPAEKAAIDQAAKFYNTPSINVYDNRGNVLLEIVNNLGNVPRDAFQGIGGEDITSEEIRNALMTAGYLEADTIHTSLTWVTSKFQPFIPGFQLNLPDKFRELLEKITRVLKQNGLISHYRSDMEGRTLQSIDPRLYYANVSTDKDYYNFRYQYAMGAEQPGYVDSADAGIQKQVSNIFDQLLWLWSARDYCQVIAYDQLQRQSKLYVRKITEPGVVTNYTDFNLVEVFTYGETQAHAPAYNLRGALIELKDLSGVVMNSSYSMRGEIMETSRQMAADYKTPVNWHLQPDLDPEVYTTRFAYDAIGLKKLEYFPNNAVAVSSYDVAGQLTAVTVALTDQTEQPVIEAIAYNAKGQRNFVKYGNGVKTTFAYEDTTLRLLNIISRRNVNGSAEAIQDLDYTYDPVGNITQVVDNSIKSVFHANQQVDPVLTYTYDALYRLLKATGRQHIGINADTYKNNRADGSFKQCIYGPPPSANDSDKLENYIAFYGYDDAGNLVDKKREARSGRFTRLLPVEDNCNRLMNYSYDESGNLRDVVINGTVDLSFNCCENLVKAAVIMRPGELDDADYYVYDSHEMRTRKVSELWQNGGATSRIEQKIYLGNYELKQIYSGSRVSPDNLSFERHTLRIMDGDRCAAVIYNITQDNKHVDKIGSTQFRFQYDNSLGSVSLELDHAAKLISYEEYFPYGGTAMITGANEAEVKLKEYRYSGKERDDSTGFYYYGARYYAPWLGRWLNPDPAGTVDGMNLYAFVGGNPITNYDVGGMMLRRFGSPLRSQMPNSRFIQKRTILTRPQQHLIEKKFGGALEHFHYELKIQTPNGCEAAADEILESYAPLRAKLNQNLPKGKKHHLDADDLETKDLLGATDDKFPGRLKAAGIAMEQTSYDIGFHAIILAEKLNSRVLIIDPDDTVIGNLSQQYIAGELEGEMSEIGKIAKDVVDSAGSGNLSDLTHNQLVDLGAWKIMFRVEHLDGLLSKARNWNFVQVSGDSDEDKPSYRKITGVSIVNKSLFSRMVDSVNDWWNRKRD